jgi:hypothetical protein
LGCGDGRICVEATKIYNCRSVGVEIEATEAEKFRDKIDFGGLKDKVSVICGDLRSVDFQEATIISIYLLPESVEEIKPLLIQSLSKGAVLVCNTWAPKSFKPISKIYCGFANNVTLSLFDSTSLP